MKIISHNSTQLLKLQLAVLALLFVIASCSDQLSSIDESTSSIMNESNSKVSMLNQDMEYELTGPVFDIAALPNGNILVADFAVVKEISKKGVKEVTTLPLVEGPGAGGATESTFINGLEPIGNRNFFATRSGLDLAVGTALFRSTRGNTRMVADIESYTLGDWPEGEAGQIPSWKNVGCEVPVGFSAGPQSNPYHLTALSGSEVLITDAAANTLLYAKTNGEIEVVATFGPVVDPDNEEPIILFPLDEDTNCFVEPVPTAVAVGPDGAYYVGELNGVVPANFGGQPTPDGLASIWRIEPDSRDVFCPSAQCTKVISGLNSVIDIEFGPDSHLYVVEYEQNGFLATVAPDIGIPLAGGTVKKCNVPADTCEIIEGADGDLFLPGAITFDKWNNLWLLDNVFAPSIRSIDWQ